MFFLPCILFFMPENCSSNILSHFNQHKLTIICSFNTFSCLCITEKALFQTQNKNLVNMHVLRFPESENCIFIGWFARMFQYNPQNSRNCKNIYITLHLYQMQMLHEMFYEDLAHSLSGAHKRNIIPSIGHKYIMALDGISSQCILTNLDSIKQSEINIYF